MRTIRRLKKRGGYPHRTFPKSVTDRSQITSLSVDIQTLKWRTTWRNLPSIFMILQDFDYLPRFLSVSPMISHLFVLELESD